MAFFENNEIMSGSEPLLCQFIPASAAVFRALQLGDMLCAVPALRALRAAMPHTHITLIGLPWAAQFVSRFRHYIDDFISFPGHPAFPEQPVHSTRVASFYREMRSRNFDIALQMHGSGETSNQVVGAFGALVTAGFTPAPDNEQNLRCFLPYPASGPEPLRLLRLAEFLGASAAGSHLEFPLLADDDDELDQFGIRDTLEPGRYLCIHPGAAMRDKCWPPERFAEVADQLAEESGLAIVLTGSAQERDLTSAVARCMRTVPYNAALPISTGAMAALMSRARLLICNDTGVSHIAAALKLPSVVIFSKADMQRWAPLDGNLHRCIWDPAGTQAAAVLDHGRSLLRTSALVGR